MAMLSAATVSASVEVGSGVQAGKFLGAKPTHYPAWFKESFLELEEDVAEAAAANKRTLLLFHQDGCPYCNALVERNLSQKPIETLMKERFDVVAINLWGDREVITIDGQSVTEKELAETLKVQFTPTVIFLDETGNTVLRLNGYLPPARFKQALDYVAEGKEKQISYRDYVAQQPKTADQPLHTQPFFRAPPHDLSAVQEPIAVFFEQSDCPACKRLHNQPLLNEETQRIASQMYVIQLDMWSDTPVITPEGKLTTARDWAKALNVNYAPTIVALDKGREVIRSEALFKTFHTQGILEYCRSRGYQKQPNFQRWLEARADHLREQGQDVNIWE